MRCKKIIHNVLNFVYEIHNCVGKSYYSEVPVIRTGTYASYIAVHSTHWSKSTLIPFLIWRTFDHSRRWEMIKEF